MKHMMANTHLCGIREPAKDLEHCISLTDFEKALANLARMKKVSHKSFVKHTWHARNHVRLVMARVLLIASTPWPVNRAVIARCLSITLSFYRSRLIRCTQLFPVGCQNLSAKSIDGPLFKSRIDSRIAVLAFSRLVSLLAKHKLLRAGGKGSRGRPMTAV